MVCNLTVLSRAIEPGSTGNRVRERVHQGRGVDIQIWMMGVASALAPECESP